MYWSRAASLGNGEARIKTGDYYYQLGTNKLPIGDYLRLIANIDFKVDFVGSVEKGSGTEKAELVVENQLRRNFMERATLNYQNAAFYKASPMAIYNMGWMYEHGIGVPTVGERFVFSTDCMELT